VLALTGKVDTVFITKNGGSAWERITTLGWQESTSERVFITKNGGSAWERITTLGWQESTSVFDIAFAGSKLYATTSHGLYVLNSF